MNILGTSEISDYQGRTVTVEVTGVCQQAVNKTASYTVHVPYSQLSQTIQRISRQGSKVAAVRLMGKAPELSVHTNASAEDVNLEAKTVVTQGVSKHNKPAAKAPRKKTRKRR
ncbi:MAG: phycobilisome linker polypeptide [Cyanobacteria bacterium P01_D01_bin.105]